MHQKNLTCPIYFCAAGANLGISSSKPTNHQTLTPHHSLQVSGMVSQMAHVTLVHLGRWANISEISLMFWDTGRNESQAILTKKNENLPAYFTREKKIYMASIPSGKSAPFQMARCRSHDGDEHGVLDEGCPATTGRIPEVCWPENASELGNFESMDIPDTLGRNNGKHCRKSACLPWIVSEKNDVQSWVLVSFGSESFWDKKKKKERSTKKTRSKERKPNKSHPLFHLERKWTLDNLGEPFPVSIHILKCQLLQKSSHFNI